MWDPDEIYTNWKLQPSLGVSCDRIITEGSDTQHAFNTQDIIECFEEHTCKFLDWSFNPKVWQRDREFYLGQNEIKGEGEQEDETMKESSMATNLDLMKPDLTFKIVIFDSSLSLFIDLTRTELMRQHVDIKGNSLLNAATCNLILKYVRFGANDTICDPMCGHGSIIKALLKKYPSSSILAGDVDKTCTEKTKENIKDLDKNDNVILKSWDAIKLPLEENSLDVIITEFPSSKDIDIGYAYWIYKSVLNSFARVTKKDTGKSVIISPSSKILDEIIGDSLYWEILDRHHMPWTEPKMNFYILKRNLEIYDEKKSKIEPLKSIIEDKQSKFHQDSGKPLMPSQRRYPMEASSSRRPSDEKYQPKFPAQPPPPSKPYGMSHSDAPYRQRYDDASHSKNTQYRNYENRYENVNKRDIN